MTLMEQIRQKQLAARKARAVEASLYTTLLGEAAMTGKNDGNRESTDSEVLAVVRKFIKNIDETLKVVSADEPRFVILNAELTALQEFLPKQLSEQELRDAIIAVKAEIGAAGPKDMGRLMAALKQKYDGQYDGKLASVVTKEVLS